MSLALQYGLIALAVLASVWVVFKKQFPGTLRRLRGSLALALVRPSRPAWLQALGRRLAPSPAADGGGCSGCDNCGPDASRKH